MYKYKCLNAISVSGLKIFNNNYQPTDEITEAEAVLVRSASMHEMELPQNLLAIARAGAGVNNIPLDKCAEQGIVVFNTPGANANGVKELVLAGMLLAARDIIGGVEWAKSEAEDPNVAKVAEKQKKQFAGNEIAGKKLGIIGLGSIGQLVANAALSLDMEVYGYDPFISVDAAWRLQSEVHHIQDLDYIFSECDYITVHVPAMDSTKGMIGADAIAKMKPTAVLLNYARDILVDEEAVVAALKAGKLKKYMTDFANPTVCGVEGVIVTPHLGASTEEAEDHCAEMAVRELREYLEQGNIINSVNFPKCDMGRCRSESRIAILHKNIPNMITQFSKIFGDAGLNIANMNATKGPYGYNLIDCDGKITDEIIAALKAIDGVFRVRVIKR